MSVQAGDRVRILSTDSAEQEHRVGQEYTVTEVIDETHFATIFGAPAGSIYVDAPNWNGFAPGEFEVIASGIAA